MTSLNTGCLLPEVGVCCVAVYEVYQVPHSVLRELLTQFSLPANTYFPV
jgi:hypothetical protein